ncbi:hypothetical protein [Hymenobacter sp. BT190]|uniref:hypothetical protein n=1 Tax=Hymenobacter sp. BT190 TaxID=2763505 RepID=UPI001651596F|nr:hypothetical protein [Hymenobacter sp. BT190]MBC6697825.1 hypothetical protein [Hymenobacter sp. BT190]
MKKVFAFFAIWIAIITIGSISYLLFYLIMNPNPTIPLLLGAIGYVVTKFYENYKDRQTRLYDKRKEIYQALVKPYVAVLTNMLTDKQTNKSEEFVLTPDQIKDSVEAASNAVMFGSDDVIKSYGRYRNISANGLADTNYNLLALAQLLKTIRKDTYTSVDEVDSLKLFINITAHEEIILRESFKNIK